MEAASPQLAGEVDPGRSGGSIRYRVWPARRKRGRALAAACFVGAAGALVWWSYQSLLWTGVTVLGLTVALAPLFFPTDVGLDGSTLHLRQLGSPRTWDLRSFKRLEVVGDALPRVELGTRVAFAPVDTVRGVTLPLPADPEMAERVLAHLRRWVGRSPTGRFEVDVDHAPEDEV